MRAERGQRFADQHVVDLYTIWTAVAPDPVLTVCTYATGAAVWGDEADDWTDEPRVYVLYELTDQQRTAEWRRWAVRVRGVCTSRRVLPGTLPAKTNDTGAHHHDYLDAEP